jgi:hypothetical protein
VAAEVSAFDLIPPGAADLSGLRFGRLEALFPAADRGNGGLKWVCRCDCGGETVARAKDLNHGNTRSCGCGRRVPLASSSCHGIEEGTRFGLLVVRMCLGLKDKYFSYLCDCDCGGVTRVRGTLLRNGQTRSCGCLAHRPAPRQAALP